MCQPHLAEETWYVKNFPRRLSIYLTKALLHMRISANQITLIMMLTGIIAGIFLGLGGYVNRLISVIFLQLFVLFDCVDGEIARYKNQVSIKGAYLDLIVNDIIHISIFLGLALGLLSNADILSIVIAMPREIIIVLGASCVIFPLLSKTAASYAIEAGAREADLSKVIIKDKKLKSLKSLLLFLHEPLRIVNIVAIAAALNALSFVLIGYGIFFPLWWLVSVITRFRKI